MWNEHYDTVLYNDALILDKQRLSFMTMFYRSKNDPAKLLEFMKEYTAYDYTLEMAKIAYEKMPARDSSVNFSDPLYDYAASGTIYYCNKIARGLSTQSGIVWATGHHGGSPVPIFAVGKGSTAVRGLHDNTWICNYLKSMIR
jgi:alkaline phosphatase